MCVYVLYTSVSRDAGKNGDLFGLELGKEVAQQKRYAGQENGYKGALVGLTMKSGLL